MNGSRWLRRAAGLGRAAFAKALAPIAVIAAALCLGGLLVLALGKDPLAAVVALFDGAFGGAGLGNLQATLNRGAMIGGAALAAGLAFRAGFINIGIEGQMVLGGVSAALLSAWLPPSPASVPAVILGAALAGGLWALLAAYLDSRLGVPLVIGSLLLNYPASYLASWLVGRPFRDVSSGMAASAQVPEAMRLPTLGDSEMQSAVIVVALVAVAMAVFLGRTAAGYEARMAGQGARFARASGIEVGRLGLYIVFASGAVAGMVGALAVLGEHYRYIDGMLVKPLYAWTGIMAVLLGGAGIPSLLAAAAFFAALSAGAMGMERSADIPREIARVILACIILMVAARGSARLPGNAGNGESSGGHG